MSTIKMCKMIGCEMNVENNKCLYCENHRPKDRNRKKCVCGKARPYFGLISDKSPTCCIKCKLDGMVDIINKKCVCNKNQPSFAFVGIKKATHCSTCKLSGMVDIKHKKCVCGKARPSFGDKGAKAPIYCFGCKEPNMINIKDKRCNASHGCETLVSKKFKGYCLSCYIHYFPEDKISRNYKTKEITIANFIKETYPDEKMTFDKRVIGGCSLKRPDCIIYKSNGQILMIEIDENQHRTYDCSCDNKRLMSLYTDLNHKNIVFIRFNPDAYFDVNNKKIKSCFSVNKKTGILRVSKKDEKSYNERLSVLKETIDYWLKHDSEKAIEIIQLFYDQNIN